MRGVYDRPGPGAPDDATDADAHGATGRSALVSWRDGRTLPALPRARDQAVSGVGIAAGSVSALWGAVLELSFAQRLKVRHVVGVNFWGCRQEGDRFIFRYDPVTRFTAVLSGGLNLVLSRGLSSIGKIQRRRHRSGARVLMWAEKDISVKPRLPNSATNNRDFDPLQARTPDGAIAAVREMLMNSVHNLPDALRGYIERSA